MTTKTNTQIPTSHSSTKNLPSRLISLIVPLIALSCTQLQAVVITVPNSNFEAPANEGAKVAPGIGLLGSYSDHTLGTGPWLATGTGIASILAAPGTDISGGDATVSGLIFIGIGSLSNSASFHQDLTGETFINGYTYTLTAEVTADNLIEIDLLSNSGVGIGLRSDAASTASSGISGALLDIDILGGGTIAELTYTITANASMHDEAIGIELFVGKGSGLADIAALGAISFDNVGLTVVPEPAAGALMLGLAGLLFVATKRRRTKA